MRSNENRQDGERLPNGALIDLMRQVTCHSEGGLFPCLHPESATFDRPYECAISSSCCIMKWITRDKVKVDRVACPWLIRKFVDSEAEFVFVPAREVEAKARELGAIPFDIEECELGHHGEDVSFNSILKKDRLSDPALQLLGEIVRAADSHPANPHPAGEGLRWVAFGFSALGLNDHEILDREFVVYDALYAECQRRVSAPESA
jgi:hypothetical protein